MWHSYWFWYEQKSEYICVKKMTRMNIRIYSYDIFWHEWISEYIHIKTLIWTNIRINIWVENIQIFEYICHTHAPFILHIYRWYFFETRAILFTYFLSLRFVCSTELLKLFELSGCLAVWAFSLNFCTILHWSTSNMVISLFKHNLVT